MNKRKIVKNEEESKPGDVISNKVWIRNITNRHFKTTHYIKDKDITIELSWLPKERKAVLPIVAKQLNKDYFKQFIED